MRTHVVLRSLAVGLALALVATACGGSPTGPAEPDAPADGAHSATASIAALNAQLEGLDPAARRAELIRLAQEEGGEVSFYGSTNPADIDPVIAAFEEQTGVEVNHYRADAASIFARIKEEAAAGHQGADVTIGGRAEYEQLKATDGLLASFETPISEQIQEGGVEPTGIDVYRVMRIVVWNTNRLTPDRYPTSWEDVFENYPGDVILDPSDWDWFATFVRTYLMGEKGMTEDEAIAYMTGIAGNAVQVKGHQLATQLVLAGEYAVTAVTYENTLPPADAPVQWREPLWPVISDSTAISILENSERPAASLLFTEFILSDAQTILYEQGGRSPANVTVESFWPDEYNDLVVPMDRGLYTDPGEAERWAGIWEQVLTGSAVGPTS